MRLICLLLLSFSASFIYGDYYSNPDFPPPNTSGGPISSPQNNPSGNDTFGALVQQQTSQALQTFQNVNYTKLSGNESQDSFFSDDDSDSAPPDPAHLFNLFAGS